MKIQFKLSSKYRILFFVLLVAIMSFFGVSCGSQEALDSTSTPMPSPTLMVLPTFTPTPTDTMVVLPTTTPPPESTILRSEVALVSGVELWEGEVMRVKLVDFDHEAGVQTFQLENGSVFTQTGSVIQMNYLNTYVGGSNGELWESSKNQSGSLFLAKAYGSDYPCFIVGEFPEKVEYYTDGPLQGSWKNDVCFSSALITDYGHGETWHIYGGGHFSGDPYGDWAYIQDGAQVEGEVHVEWDYMWMSITPRSYWRDKKIHDLGVSIQLSDAVSGIYTEGSLLERPMKACSLIENFWSEVGIDPVEAEAACGPMNFQDRWLVGSWADNDSDFLDGQQPEFTLVGSSQLNPGESDLQSWPPELPSEYEWQEEENRIVYHYPDGGRTNINFSAGGYIFVAPDICFPNHLEFLPRFDENCWDDLKVYQVP